MPAAALNTRHPASRAWPASSASALQAGRFSLLPLTVLSMAVGGSFLSGEHEAVIVVLDAHDELADARRWLFSLGDVDAIALDGVSTSPTPALMMQLGVPITRLDGIPIDRLTWTALLCAQLEAANPA